MGTGHGSYGLAPLMWHCCSSYRYTDTDDAIRLVNDSGYGLGGTVQTSDPDRPLGSGMPLRGGQFYYGEP